MLVGWNGGKGNAEIIKSENHKVFDYSSWIS